MQRILMGDVSLSFGDNEHINVVSENGIPRTVQRMGARLDRLDDFQKSCQLSGTDQENLPLQRQFSLISRTCDVNCHKAPECSRSPYGN